MKKWSYIIFPAIMLGVFVAFYMASKHKWDAAEAQRTAEVQKAKEADDAKKASAEEAARIAARKRVEEQKKEDAAFEQKRQDKWNAETAAIVKVTDTAKAEADASSKESADLELQIDNLRKKKEALNREDFDLLKNLELARSRQRDAELDIQRMVTMITDKAAQSQMAAVRPVAVEPAK